MVSVLNAHQQFLAGGVLIAADKVLTSALVGNRTDVDQLRVRAGEWNRQSDDESYPHQDRLVRQFLPHENFAGGNYKYNNIALIQLRMRFTNMPHISPICLADSLNALDPTNCFVTAWGSRSAVLQSFPISAMSTTECESKLRAERIIWFGGFIRENLLCASAQPSIESCGVDDGSPLVCAFKSSPKQYGLAGLVNCGWRSAQLSHTQLPGIYSNVTHFAAWIKNSRDISNKSST
ncbi:hypothetical protein KR044_007343 [Drosophila immigrans]|nr:hypothetical protein KR044_007343 [Drosophila immigrans]